MVIEKDNEPLKYVPLPTDRDNAFYNPNGLILWLITRPFSQPRLRPFRKKIDHLPGMIKPFDQFFLLNVPESTFLEVAYELQEDFTDEKIKNAFNSWPSEFVEIDTKKMVKYIKARRSDLPKYAKAFKAIVVERGTLLVPLKGSSKKYKSPIPTKNVSIQ